MARPQVENEVELSGCFSARFIALDIETSGLSPVGGDEIVEIAAVELLEPRKFGKLFHSRIRSRTAMSKAAEDVVGFTNCDLDGAPAFAELADYLVEFLRDATIVGIGTEFDRAFLNGELAEAGFGAMPRTKFLDLTPFIPEAIRRSGMDAIKDWAGSAGGGALATEVVAGAFWRIRKETGV